MNEKLIRDAYTYGAGDGAPGEAMWSRVQSEIRHRRARGELWRRVAVAACSLLLIGTAAAVASPGVRAAVIAATNRALAFTLVPPPSVLLRVRKAAPWSKFDSPAAAAQYLGFVPAEAGLPAAKLQSVQAQRSDQDDSHERRTAQLHYQVGTTPYTVATAAVYAKVEGTWAFTPYDGITAGIVARSKPESPRPVEIGGRQVLCYDWPGSSPSSTVCSFLAAGRQVEVSGPDPATVVDLAKSIR